MPPTRRPGPTPCGSGRFLIALLLSAKAHIDNVVRELTLLRDGGGVQRRRV